jgi:hypothetical protein
MAAVPTAIKVSQCLDHFPTYDFPCRASASQDLLFKKMLKKFCFLAKQRWAKGWTIGVVVFGSRRGLGIFLFITASRTALGPTKPPIQWISRALSLGVKQSGREADHSPPSSAEVK